MARIVVIGAGMGGLAAALRLRQAGHEVRVIEKLDQAGGRSRQLRVDGFRVDMGPTILVMRDVFDRFYASLGESLQARVPMQRLDPNYRLYFHDGDQLDLHRDPVALAHELNRFEPAGAAKYARFMEAGQRKYELGMPFVQRNYQRLTDLANPTAAVRLLRTRAHENLYRQVSRIFSSDKLRKAFSFHSMFLGLSPFAAPAMYSLITYADLALGMWYPQGGIYRLIEDMVDLAADRQIPIDLSRPARSIRIEHGRVQGVETDEGLIPADLVVANADLPYTYQALIAPEHRPSVPDRRLQGFDFACSGYLLYLGLRGTFPHLQHQSLYFTDDYAGNLADVFERGLVPQPASFHMNAPSVSDPTVAPPGHSVLYVLAPMPNLQADIDWDRAAPAIRSGLLDRLEQLVAPDLRQRIVWQQEYLPTDFAHDLNAVHGTAFGSLSHNFFQSSYFRPHNQSPDIDGLYFVGQGTYPGIGLPMVQLSAELVTERIQQRWS